MAIEDKIEWSVERRYFDEKVLEGIRDYVRNREVLGTLLPVMDKLDIEGFGTIRTAHQLAEGYKLSLVIGRRDSDVTIYCHASGGDEESNLFYVGTVKTD